MNKYTEKSKQIAFRLESNIIDTIIRLVCDYSVIQLADDQGLHVNERSYIEVQRRTNINDQVYDSACICVCSKRDPKILIKRLSGQFVLAKRTCYAF